MLPATLNITPFTTVIPHDTAFFYYEVLLSCCALLLPRLACRLFLTCRTKTSLSFSKSDSEPELTSDPECGLSEASSGERLFTSASFSIVDVDRSGSTIPSGGLPIMFSENLNKISWDPAEAPVEDIVFKVGIPVWIVVETGEVV